MLEVVEGVLRVLCMIRDQWNACKHEDAEAHKVSAILADRMAAVIPKVKAWGDSKQTLTRSETQLIAGLKDDVDDIWDWLKAYEKDGRKHGFFARGLKMTKNMARRAMGVETSYDKLLEMVEGLEKKLQHLQIVVELDIHDAVMQVLRDQQHLMHKVHQILHALPAGHQVPQETAREIAGLVGVEVGRVVQELRMDNLELWLQVHEKLDHSFAEVNEGVQEVNAGVQELHRKLDNLRRAVGTRGSKGKGDIGGHGRVKLCKFWVQGNCKKGSDCKFKHGHEEGVNTQSLETKFCSNCGTSLSAGANFCGEGGASAGSEDSRCATMQHRVWSQLHTGPSRRQIQPAQGGRHPVPRRQGGGGGRRGGRKRGGRGGREDKEDGGYDGGGCDDGNEGGCNGGYDVDSETRTKMSQTADEIQQTVYGIMKQGEEMITRFNELDRETQSQKEEMAEMCTSALSVCNSILDEMPVNEFDDYEVQLEILQGQLERLQTILVGLKKMNVLLEVFAVERQREREEDDRKLEILELELELLKLQNLSNLKLQNLSEI